MGKKKLGTKRIDPETGKKFYDLNKDPVISPYTGISYPLSFFDSSIDLKEDELEEEEFDTDLEKDDFVALDDEGDDAKAKTDLPDIEDDVVGLDDETEPFLSEDSDEDTDMAEFITPAVPGDDEN